MCFCSFKAVNVLRTSQQPRGGTSCAESADRNGVAEKGVEEYYNSEVKLLLQPQRSIHTKANIFNRKLLTLNFQLSYTDNEHLSLSELPLLWTLFVGWLPLQGFPLYKLGLLSPTCSGLTVETGPMQKGERPVNRCVFLQLWRWVCIHNISSFIYWRSTQRGFRSIVQARQHYWTSVLSLFFRWINCFYPRFALNNETSENSHHYWGSLHLQQPLSLCVCACFLCATQVHCGKAGW